MGRISTGTGLISGINSRDIIDQLMALEAQPKQKLQDRIDSTNQQKLAFTDLVTRLTNIKLAGTTLKKPSAFQATTATSSNEDVLSATTGTAAAVGTYQFQVARMVSTQQSVSNGFADADTVKVGAATLTFEQGGGELTQQTLLSQLRGGEGIRRGVFRITDRSGASAVIDTSAAVSLEDVVKKINTSLDISVKATLNGDRVVLNDITGKTTSNFIVQDLGDGFSAADLGIVASAASNTITGSDINFLGRSTMLSQINDGRGVRKASGGADFQIALSDGSTVDVNITSARTIGEVVDAINTAGAGNVTADIVAGANGIRITDNTGGAGSFEITALNNSSAAKDLGILQTGAGGVISGNPLIANFNTVLISSLRGGSGLNLGHINITDRAGNTADVDLSGARTVQDIITAISNAGGAAVTASLKASGNGIQIVDDSGGSGDLVIAENGSTTAAELGILGTFNTTTIAVQGANLQRQWVSENSLLKTYNGGKGVTPGKFKITNSAGISATVDLTQGNEVTLGHVIAEINAKGINVTASINANGDGLLLTDTANGATRLKVEEIDSTTAKNLNILGEATATTIDGTFEKTVVLDANDTLATAQTKINNAGLGVRASVINDGSGVSPFRLSLNAINSGRNGRVVFDAGTSQLATRNLVESQDAAVFLGGTDTSQPLLITGSDNQLSGVIPGVTINLNGVSTGPVTLNIARSSDAVVDQLKSFTQNFNDMIAKMADLTKFDTATNTKGILLGDATVQQIETTVYSMLQTVVQTGGKYRLLADVGMKLGNGAKLEFDEEKFRAAFADDSEAVSKLFSTTELGVGYAIENRIAKLIDPVNGVITRENQTLDQKTTQFQSRIDALDKLLTNKRDRLERQFASMESVLASLQTQQQALSSLSVLTANSGRSGRS